MTETTEIRAVDHDAFCDICGQDRTGAVVVENRHSALYICVPCAVELVNYAKKAGLV